jgi:hypothetical protein
MPNPGPGPNSGNGGGSAYPIIHIARPSLSVTSVESAGAFSNQRPARLPPPESCRARSRTVAIGTVDVCGALQVGARSGEEWQSAGIAGNTGREAASGGSLGRRPETEPVAMVVGEGCVGSVHADTRTAKKRLVTDRLFTATSTLR